MTSAQARSQIQAYVRRLLGPDRQAGGMSSIKLPLPKGRNTGSGGETSHALPRQLAATAYTKFTNKSSNSASKMGNAWLISPMASTVKSILSLFGGGDSTAQSTGYRTASRRTFRIVEGIAPVTGSGMQRLNESAAELTDAISRTLPDQDASKSSFTLAQDTKATLSAGGISRVEDRQALVAALRRGFSESSGISDVLSEFQDGL